ncbi:hypothetical protein Taro_009563 [Colocasia esculenta]|uniref:Uncharacterized protein n=1 Tax=Colocasia esculenta TaxID=4460 RepID=A0A843U6W1_COLES|nr:hypothetical protein [Colocasia esculenta]
MLAPRHSCLHLPDWLASEQAGGPQTLMDDVPDMASSGGSYSGLMPRRQRITSQQTILTHSASEGSAAAISTVGSTTFVAGPVSSQAWGRGYGRRGLSRDVTDRRLEFGQRWNVKHYTGKSFEDAIVSVPVGVNPHDWQTMCEKWNTSDEQERMIQLSATSLDSESGSTPIFTEEAFISVVGKDRSSSIRCRGSRETRRSWYVTGKRSSSSNYQQ